jgi:hypothetical protein
VNPEPVIPEPTPPAPLETSSEALQKPETASDVLGAPSSPLPASLPNNEQPSNPTTGFPLIDPESVPVEVPLTVTSSVPQA